MSKREEVVRALGQYEGMNLGGIAREVKERCTKSVEEREKERERCKSLGNKQERSYLGKKRREKEKDELLEMGDQRSLVH